MRIYKQLPNQWLTSIACQMLLSMIATTSVHAVAAAPTPLQKLEFGQYITPIFTQTSHTPFYNGWNNFHTNNNYVRSEILGYSVPKKLLENGDSFIAHGIISHRSNKPGQNIIYRFTGDGSYWVPVRQGVTSPQPEVISIAEYLKLYATNANGFFVETTGENAVRKWKSALKGGKILWEASSESPQEALDVYNDRVFVNPLNSDPVDIEAGDPSLEPEAPLVIEGMEIEFGALEDANVETALRRTMILNTQLQLLHKQNPGSGYSDMLKELRNVLYSMEAVEIDAIYGKLSTSLPRAPDYDFPPGCPG